MSDEIFARLGQAIRNTQARSKNLAIPKQISNAKVEQTQSPQLTHLECKHRGVEIDKIVCGPCGGKVQLKVFSCGIHNKCVLARTIEGYNNCSTCSDKSA